METKTIHLLVSANYPGCENPDPQVVLMDSILQELRIEDAIHDALNQLEVTHIIASGSTLDPSIVPDDIVSGMKKQDVIQAIATLERYRANCRTSVATMKSPLLPALDIALPILTKCLHTHYAQKSPE